jgi:Flp pilus assembly protein TadG
MKMINKRKFWKYQRDTKGNLKRGQGMVEFALILPILVVLILGIIEAARLIFIYGSVITASREAARYGSAAGLIASDSEYFRYQDCAGIRARAENVTFLTDDSDLTITIEYDSGPGTSVYDTCVDVDGDGVDAGIDVLPASDGVPKRIVVTASILYEPLVPILPQFTTFTMETTSARTFLGVVEYWP